MAVPTFLALLVDIDVLPTNPDEDVYPPAGESPLPEVLHDNEADTLRMAVAQMATRAEDPDRVPALLALFFLDLGLRAGEVVRLTTQDIDLANRLRPVVHIRYAHRRHRAKRRKLIAPPDLSVLMDRHLAAREENGHQLLTYSSRDIRRILEELGKQAGIQRSANPSVPRWTFAVNQWRGHAPHNTLQNRMGLSDPGWLDVREVLAHLAQQPV